jgi:hypothetical protein
MIHQIAPVKTKTAPLPKLNKDLLQARHIQARVKKDAQQLPTHIEILSPITNGPFLVPVTRWIE